MVGHHRRWKLSQLTAFSHAQEHLRVQTVHGAIGESGGSAFATGALRPPSGAATLVPPPLPVLPPRCCEARVLPWQLVEHIWCRLPS